MNGLICNTTLKFSSSERKGLRDRSGETWHIYVVSNLWTMPHLNGKLGTKRKDMLVYGRLTQFYQEKRQLLHMEVILDFGYWLVIEF